MPLLQAAHEKFRDLGLEVVGIGVDQHAKIVEYAAKYGISYPILVGDIRALDVLRDLSNAAGALPYTVLLDRKGAIAYRKLGPFKGEELDEVLSTHLG